MRRGRAAGLSLAAIVSGWPLAAQSTRPAQPREIVRPPAARIGHISEAVDEKLFVFGGLPGDAREDRGQSGWRYDPLEKRWNPTAPMPTPRVFAASAVLGGRILVMGGIPADSRAYVPTVEAYDPRRDAWEKLPDMSLARSRFGAVAIAGKVYVVSGLEGSDDQCRTGVRLDEFDPASNHWSRKCDIPHGRHAFAAVAFDGRLYVLGGYLDEAGRMTPCNLVESYDPKTNAWRTEPPMNCTRSWFSAVVFESAIVALGGLPEGPPGPEQFGRTATRWESINQTDIVGRRFSASVVGSEILVTGGEGGGRPFLRSIRIPPATP